MKHSLLRSAVHPLRYAAALLSGLMLVACDSDDNSGNEALNGNNGTAYTVANVDGAPAWQVDWQYNQTRPNWQEPQAPDYENWTVITVEIEDELKDMTSSNDLLAVLIDDEVCGLASPAISIGGDESDATCYYILKVYSNRSDEYQSVTLNYYSDRLQQVFTSYGDISFSRYDDATELIPNFLSGSEKYPLTTSLDLQLTATETSGVQPAAGDLLAAFVGNECRGVCTIYETPLNDPLSLHVYGKDSEETITLRYYHAATNRVFTFAQTVSMADGWQTISLNF